MELRSDGRTNLVDSLLIAGEYIIPEVCGCVYHHRGVWLCVSSQRCVVVCIITEVCGCVYVCVYISSQKCVVVCVYVRMCVSSQRCVVVCIYHPRSVCMYVCIIPEVCSCTCTYIYHLDVFGCVYICNIYYHK